MLNWTLQCHNFKNDLIYIYELRHEETRFARLPLNDMMVKFMSNKSGMKTRPLGLNIYIRHIIASGPVTVSIGARQVFFFF